VAVGHLGLARLHALGADLARQVLGRDRAVAVHQHDQRLGVLVLHDQGLDHGVLVQAQLACGFRGAAVLHVVIRVLGEGHSVGLEPLGGRGFTHMDFVFFGHG